MQIRDAGKVRRVRNNEALEETSGLDDNTKTACGFLKLFANEVRLDILCLLVDGEKSVGEIGRLIGVRQSTISQQLARLRYDNAVTTRRHGKRVFYRLADDRVARIVEVIYDVFCQDGCRDDHCSMRHTKG